MQTSFYLKHKAKNSDLFNRNLLLIIIHVLVIYTLVRYI